MSSPPPAPPPSGGASMCARPRTSPGAGSASSAPRPTATTGSTTAGAGARRRSPEGSSSWPLASRVMRIFRVASFVPERHLTLDARAGRGRAGLRARRRHVPRGRPRRRAVAAPGEAPLRTAARPLGPRPRAAPAVGRSRHDAQAAPDPRPPRRGQRAQISSGLRSLAISVIRFDFRAPAFSPASRRELFDAALEMAAFADARGFKLATLSEHHGVEDGYLPSPLVMAGVLAGRTQPHRPQRLGAPRPALRPGEARRGPRRCSTGRAAGGSWSWPASATGPRSTPRSAATVARAGSSSTRASRSCSAPGPVRRSSSRGGASA